MRRFMRTGPQATARSIPAISSPRRYSIATGFTWRSAGIRFTAARTARGNLVCIDPTKTGDVTGSGKVWTFDNLNAALTTVSIADGLVFVIDEARVIHCLDADNGQNYWNFALKGDGGQLNSALLAVDGKLFAGKSILAVSKTLKTLGTIEGNTFSSCASPCVANGVLFKVHDDRLWALCDTGEKMPQAK